jgi:hypothetical protein
MHHFFRKQTIAFLQDMQLKTLFVYILRVKPTLTSRRPYTFSTYAVLHRYRSSKLSQSFRRTVSYSPSFEAEEIPSL